MEARTDLASIEPPDGSAKFHVIVEFASTFGTGRNTPARISCHHGRSWVVNEVLDRWVHPDHRGYREELGFPAGDVTATRFLLEVNVPLPHTNGSGPQRVWLRSYGDGSGWYLRPDQTGWFRPGPDARLS